MNNMNELITITATRSEWALLLSDSFIASYEGIGWGDKRIIMAALNLPYTDEFSEPEELVEMVREIAGGND